MAHGQDRGERKVFNEHIAVTTLCKF